MTECLCGVSLVKRSFGFTADLVPIPSSVCVGNVSQMPNKSAFLILVLRTYFERLKCNHSTWNYGLE